MRYYICTGLFIPWPLSFYEDHTGEIFTFEVTVVDSDWIFIKGVNICNQHVIYIMPFDFNAVMREATLEEVRVKLLESL